MMLYEFVDHLAVPFYAANMLDAHPVRLHQRLIALGTIEQNDIGIPGGYVGSPPGGFRPHRI